NPGAALAVLLPLALVGEQRRVHFTHRGDDGAKAVRQFLPGEFAQEWFRIKRVEMARSALHEKENDALGLGREMLRFGCHRVGGRGRRGEQALLIQQKVQRHRAKARARAQQEIAPRVKQLVVRDKGAAHYWLDSNNRVEFIAQKLSRPKPGGRETVAT